MKHKIEKKESKEKKTKTVYDYCECCFEHNEGKLSDIGGYWDNDEKQFVFANLCNECKESKVCRKCKRRECNKKIKSCAIHQCKCIEKCCSNGCISCMPYYHMTEEEWTKYVRENMSYEEKTKTHMQENKQFVDTLFLFNKH